MNKNDHDQSSHSQPQSPIDAARLERAILAIERISIETQESCDRQSAKDARDEERATAKGTGLTLQPWVITLLISIALNIGGFAYTWGTVISRLEAIQSRVDRIEKQIDTQERLRSPANYKSPPISGFGLGPALAWINIYR